MAQDRNMSTADDQQNPLVRLAGDPLEIRENAQVAIVPRSGPIDAGVLAPLPNFEPIDEIWAMRSIYRRLPIREQQRLAHAALGLGVVALRGLLLERRPPFRHDLVLAMLARVRRQIALGIKIELLVKNLLKFFC